MALLLANRVQETATANTTVSFTLTGAVAGFQTFATIGNTNTTYYSATDASGNWEVGLGTYSTTGPTLTRTTVYASSNAGSAVTFSGTVNVFVTYPSGRSVNLDASGNVSALGTVSSGTWQGSAIAVANGGTGQTTYANGQLLIGDASLGGGTLTKATLTAGTNITISNTAGGITISAAGGGGGGSPATPLVRGLVFGRTTCTGCCSKTALGYNAGACVQGMNTVAIGAQAGLCTQGNSSIAIGSNAASTLQGNNAIAIGYSAGGANQSSYSIAIGCAATNSCLCVGSSVAIGAAAATSGACKGYQVAIGAYTSSSGYNGTAIGSGASANGDNSTAIGPGTTSAGGQTNRTYIGPIRNATATYTLKYNPTTREVTYI